jgi:hypothetical protein
MMTPTRLDYCQYLLVSQINYTLTHYAEHSDQYSHDALNRYVDADRPILGDRLPHLRSAGRRQGHQDQRICGRNQSQTVPGRGVDAPHGLARNRRSGSDALAAAQEACGRRGKIEQFSMETPERVHR